MIEVIDFEGWPNCYRLANERLEVVATSVIGPRIVRFGRRGGANQFSLLTDTLGLTGGDVWRLYGGHRLIRSPEVPELSYVPDNSPIGVEAGADRLRLVQPVEAPTGIQKTIEVRLYPDFAEVVHTLANRGSGTALLAPWALSIMRLGGVAIAPLPAAPDSLLPDRAVVLWPYTSLDDPRVRWGNPYITLRQDPGRAPKFKIGLTVSEGWLAYLHGGDLFVKTFQPAPGSGYPDFGSVVEMYADDRFLELESLGPLQRLEPGQAVTHVECWHLFEGVGCDPNSDEAIEAVVKPLIERARRADE